MKYVLKEDKSNPAYVVLSNGFHYVFTLEEATHFPSISSTIDAVIANVLKHPMNFTHLTIVGVKEVTTPHYEEVEL